MNHGSTSAAQTISIIPLCAVYACSGETSANPGNKQSKIDLSRSAATGCDASVCAGYTNRIPLAPVGAHVRATGTYVIDSHNGWAEIHPVSKLEVM